MNICIICNKETDEYNFDNKLCDTCYKMVEWLCINAEENK